MKKLVLFGDSLFGRVGKSQILDMESALPGYDIYNCAAGGWDTNDAVQKSPYIAKLAPDVVVVSLGTNDAAPWKQVPLETFVNNLPKILKTFAGSKIIFFPPPPVNQELVLEFKKSLTNEVLKPYHDEILKACREHGVAAVDSWSVFMPLLESGQVYHIDDGIHLGDLAYETLNNELAKLL